MKKIISVILSVLMLLSVVSLVGCGAKSENVKFGLGVHSYLSEVKNAEKAKEGSGTATTTAAAVLLDKNGKIVDCKIDTLDATLSFKNDGTFVKSGEFKTKYEMGEAYGMKQYGGAAKEWFEQVDAFIASVKGKNITEVKAMMTEDKKGNEEIVKAGCTITISDFVVALEKAVNNAADSTATAEDTAKLGIVATQSSDSKDAKKMEKGANKISVTVAALAVDSKGTVTAASTDSVDASVEFDVKGTATTVSDPFTTKKALGDKYGMKSASPIKKEWFEQANAFASKVVGKTADTMASLIDEKGYGVEEVQTAGCTMNVYDMQAAAAKAIANK